MLENKFRGKISSWSCVKDATEINCTCKTGKCKGVQKSKGAIKIDGKGKRLSEAECIESFIHNI